MNALSRTAILAAIATVSLSAPAHAASVRYSVEFESGLTGGPTQTVFHRYELPLFDTRLGSLEGVEFSLTSQAYLNLNYTMTNSPLSETYGVWLPTNDVYLNAYPYKPTYLELRPPSGFAVSASAGPGDYTGTGSGSASGTIDAENYDLSAFWASERLEFIYGEELWGLSEAGGGSDLVVTGYSKHRVSIVYTYAPGVPEPTIWATMILGLGTAGGALRWHATPKARRRSQRPS